MAKLLNLSYVKMQTDIFKNLINSGDSINCHFRPKNLFTG